MIFNSNQWSIVYGAEFYILEFVRQTSQADLHEFNRMEWVTAPVSQKKKIKKQYNFSVFDMMKDPDFHFKFDEFEKRLLKVRPMYCIGFFMKNY